MTDESGSELPIYHICFTVPDLDSAMAELSELIGVDWGRPADEQLGAWPYRITFSRSQPHLELIQGAPGSPWYRERPMFHHLGIWTLDLADCLAGWTAAGANLDFDARPEGRRFAYVDAPQSGAKLEAVDIRGLSTFRQRWVDRRPPPN